MTTVRALVIDDDEEIIRTVGDILDSLRHSHDAAGDQEGARKLLASGRYSYVLLDLEIPIRPGHLSRVQNGKNLLHEIRRTPNMEDVPIIVMTGHGNDSYELAVSVMKDGAVDYVGKPLDGDKLDRAIHHALASSARSASATRAQGAPKTLVAFKAEPREMVIYEDRVTVCGVEVWKDAAQPDLRLALISLSKRDKDGYIRTRGAKLDKELGRDSSNPIARRIKDFRDRATEALREKGLECGKYDIVAKGSGGYHLTEWMVVGAAGKPEPKENAAAPARKGAEAGGAFLNDRQKWILEQLDQGVQLRHKTIVKHTGKNRSTINRDLKELRDRGQITTHEDGYYVRGPNR